MTRLQQILFLGWFVAILFLVPLSQAGLEIAAGRRPRFLEIFTSAPTEANLRLFERRIEESSHWAQAARPAMQSLWLKLDEAGEKVVVGRQGWLFYKPDVRYLVEPHDGAGALAAIAGFRDQLSRRGIRLLVLPVPGKPSLYPEKLTRRGGARSLTGAFIARLRQSGVEVVDLFGPSSLGYLKRDTHWSGAAARQAAGIVAGRIRELNWAAAGSTEYAVRPVRVARKSDISRMIGLQDLEEVACEQVVLAGSGELYRDDPASPVLVLGDSFLRIYQTDEPRAAGFIAHLARELRRPLASVVNDGGASTLVRQELSRRPELLRGKSLVIWEFVERDIRFGAEGWKPVPLP